MIHSFHHHSNVSGLQTISPCLLQIGRYAVQQRLNVDHERMKSCREKRGGPERLNGQLSRRSDFQSNLGPSTEFALRITGCGTGEYCRSGACTRCLPPVCDGPRGTWCHENEKQPVRHRKSAVSRCGVPSNDSPFVPSEFRGAWVTAMARAASRIAWSGPRHDSVLPLSRLRFKDRTGCGQETRRTI